MASTSATPSGYFVCVPVTGSKIIIYLYTRLWAPPLTYKKTSHLMCRACKLNATCFQPRFFYNPTARKHYEYYCWTTSLALPVKRAMPVSQMCRNSSESAKYVRTYIAHTRYMSMQTRQHTSHAGMLPAMVEDSVTFMVRSINVQDCRNT